MNELHNETHYQEWKRLRDLRVHQAISGPLRYLAEGATLMAANGDFQSALQTGGEPTQGLLLRTGAVAALAYIGHEVFSEGEVAHAEMMRIRETESGLFNRLMDYIGHPNLWPRYKDYKGRFRLKS